MGSLSSSTSQWIDFECNEVFYSFGWCDEKPQIATPEQDKLLVWLSKKTSQPVQTPPKEGYGMLRSIGSIG
jgi:hypothetical protein